MGLFDGNGMRLGFGVLYTALLIAACITDIRSRRLPNVLVGAFAVSGLAFSAIVTETWAAVGWAVVGMALGFGIWVVSYALGQLGMGDVKLAAAAGAWLGVGGILRASLVAMVVGGVLAVFLLARERRVGDALRRIGLTVSTGSLTVLKPGADNAAVTVARRGRPMPYGVALAIGALVAAWFPGVLG
jgi:prepilin peptidase CpaA